MARVDHRMTSRGIAALTLTLALAAACAGGTSAPRAQAPPPAPAPPATVDALLAEAWRAEGLVPAPPASDAEFLRRVTLDLVGRVPTVAEARAFLDDRGADKRARLVDRLLASSEWAEHMADVYGDLLLGREARLRGGARREAPGRAYLVAAFRENRRWDRLTTELITATGDVRERGAGAYVAAHVARGNDAATAASATARIFLGVSIQCAQCHDHPYEPRYTQADFTAFAAFFGEVRARRDRSGAQPTIVLEDRVIPAVAREGSARGERLRERAAARARARGRELPAWRFTAPRFLGREVAIADGEPRRVALAREIVASDLFAKAAVNRTWAQLFGAGLVDPWDDLGVERDPAHPPALDRLAADFRASGHDLRALYRAIVLSATYGRSSAFGPPDGARFAAARVRPLGADQIFASLLTATGVEAMARGRFRGDVAAAKARALREYLFVFPDDEMGEADDFSGSVAQALLLFNGEVTNLGALAAPGGVLAATLAASDDPARRLETLYLAAYARRPTAEERAALLPSLTAADTAAWEDLYFAMLTSSEFLTNH